jgi:hypothetical protein
MWYEFIRNIGLDIVSARGYIRRPFATITNFIIIIIIATLRADFANRAHASVTMVERGIASTRFAHVIPDDDVRSSIGGGARTVRLEAPGRCAHASVSIEGCQWRTVTRDVSSCGNAVRFEVSGGGSDATVSIERCQRRVVVPFTLAYIFATDGLPSE